ncbi:hypothetical protein ACGFZ9_50085 [Streptomyces mirabilis]|uniref:hypothetical protein n=1 Tax=Streptomyces mirabilis TaxID=68239 RepID=UPI00372229D6
MQPVDVEQLPIKERGRRDRMSQILRSLSNPLMAWYNQPIGLCEAQDTTLPRDRQRCPATATHAVRFHQDVTEVDVYTCPAHARPMAATADRAVYINAAIYPLR